jgi:uncharacterized protein YcbK (DUF882 family)
MTSLNFSISELCKSDIAKQKNIRNVPGLNELDNMLNLIVYCLQPIRDYIKRPMIISSGYRSYALNKEVGGVYNSQHRKGQAVDFTIKGLSISETIAKIRQSGIEFDQLINEYDKWVHVSFVKGKNRKQIKKIS